MGGQPALLPESGDLLTPARGDPGPRAAPSPSPSIRRVWPLLDQVAGERGRGASPGGSRG